MNKNKSGGVPVISPEILAPAGSRESLEAAVRAGADAVYLGGKSLNARRGAANFTDAELCDAVSYCKVRGVSVYQAVNTVIFPDELPELDNVLDSACKARVSGIIVQDLSVVSAVLRCCPSMSLHASTQMSVHNLDGVKMLEQMGFSRVVLARELSVSEIEYIAGRTKLELEVFVHGALCMCMSGQCYLSSMIGTRSGNRGMCAQPCRLPFSSKSGEYALSLKDMSLVGHIGELASVGVASLKIEGRLKRPEYVAAAVGACREAADGGSPDTELLEAVFSRGGLTDGYLTGKLGDGMFGTRGRDDVMRTASALKAISVKYSGERQSVPLCMDMDVCARKESVLTVSDGDGNSVRVEGAVPQAAINTPTTADRAEALLKKTGGTPYFAAFCDILIGDGLMLPASEINAMRREALEKLTELRARIPPINFIHTARIENGRIGKAGKPELRARVSGTDQLSDGLFSAADSVIVPVECIRDIGWDMLESYGDKITAELPRFIFGHDSGLEKALEYAKSQGISDVTAGNLGSLRKALDMGFAIHGDFGLNITNGEALDGYADLGLRDAVLSLELSLENARKCVGKIPVGLLVYGRLPLMATRNNPKGSRGSGVLTDRLGNKFPLKRSGGVTGLHNMLPLYLADRLEDFNEFAFLTLYFNGEDKEECVDIFKAYKSGKSADFSMTRGLYYRKVD